MPKPKYHIVVCTNARPPGHPKPSCGSAGSAQLLMAFNMGLMQRGVMPGEVLVSQAVVEASAGAEVAFREIGPVELKGVTGAMHLYAATGAGA